MTPFTVNILGSSSATPTSARNPSSQLLNINHKFILIDCGEGTQIQLRKMGVKLSRLNHIFISHLHGDHFFGLIGLISTMNLYGRTEPLWVYGNPTLRKIIDLQLEASQTCLLFPFNFVEVNSEGYELLLDAKDFTVSSFPLEHRIETTGFIVREKPRSPKIRKEILIRESIPTKSIASIKAGKDYLTPDGRLIKNSEITYPLVQPRVYAYCSDTLFSETYLQFIREVNLLYHEATFLHELKDIAHEKYHSTCFEAAMAAKLAEVEKLMLGHFSARYKDLQPLIDEARSVFPNTILASEGLKIDV